MLIVKNRSGVMPNAPAVIGTNARTGGRKRARNTAALPYFAEERFAAFDDRPDTCSTARASRDPMRITVPEQISQAVAGHGAADRRPSTPVRLRSPAGIKALRLRMMVEPGMKEPDDRHGFEERRQKQLSHKPVRMRGNEIGRCA